jgi:hypothetical protein
MSDKSGNKKLVNSQSFFRMAWCDSTKTSAAQAAKRAAAETFKEWSHTTFRIIHHVTTVAYLSLQQPARRKFSLRRGPPLNVHRHLYSVAYHPVHASQLICLAFRTLFLPTSIFQETWLRPDGKTAPSSFLYFSLFPSRTRIDW